MPELVDEFKKAREQLIEIINRFPVEKRVEVLFGNWSLKDILAHIAAWDLYTLETLQNLKRGTYSKEAEQVDVSEYNKAQTEKRKNLGWDEVYHEFLRNGQKLLIEYQSLPNELWDKRFWPNKGYTPKKFIKIDIDHYTKEHLPEIIKHLS